MMHDFLRQQYEWYFEGYTRGEVTLPNGRTKQVWTFTGEGYRFLLSGQELRRLKIQLAVLAVAAGALFFPIAFLRVPATSIPYVGGFMGLMIIPYIYLYLGLVNFLCAPERMSTRNLYTGVRRFWRALFWCILLCMAAAAGCLVFLLASPFSTGKDGIVLAILLVCLVLFFTQRKLLRNAIRKSTFASMFHLKGE